MRVPSRRQRTVQKCRVKHKVCNTISSSAVSAATQGSVGSSSGRRQHDQCYNRYQYNATTSTLSSMQLLLLPLPLSSISTIITTLCYQHLLLPPHGTAAATRQSMCLSSLFISILILATYAHRLDPYLHTSSGQSTCSSCFGIRRRRGQTSTLSTWRSPSFGMCRKPTSICSFPAPTYEVESMHSALIVYACVPARAHTILYETA